MIELKAEAGADQKDSAQGYRCDGRWQHVWGIVGVMIRLI